MAQICFHPSIEGAQHGAKSLPDFLAYAKRSGAAGAQPSNYMLGAAKGFQSAKEIKAAFTKAKMKLDGVSAHCPFWVHTTAWTGSPSIRPFIPADVAKKSPEQIERWAEDYILGLLDLCAELGVKIVPLFWGVAFGWELATGYPRRFWKGGDYDLLAEGSERFVKKTAKIRARAKSLGIYLAHEIHPGTGASCADDFNLLVKICDGDKTLAVNADPTYCWEGEGWEALLSKVGDRIYTCNVKAAATRLNNLCGTTRPNRIASDLERGGLQLIGKDFTHFAKSLINVGYPARFCREMGTKTAPFGIKTEGNCRDARVSKALKIVREKVCPLNAVVEKPTLELTEIMEINKLVGKLLTSEKLQDKLTVMIEQYEHVRDCK